MADGEEHEYSLVMPFLPVTSKGGPYDDQAYVAGFEVGQLYQKLLIECPKVWIQTVHTTNVAQVDLIAMRCGYLMTYKEERMDATWTQISLNRGDSTTTHIAETTNRLKWLINQFVERGKLFHIPSREMSGAKMGIEGIDQLVEDGECQHSWHTTRVAKRAQYCPACNEKNE